MNRRRLPRRRSSASPRPSALRPAPPRRRTVRRILRLGTGKVEEVSLEDYVAAVLPAEIGAHAPAAALEAQAVAARSYAVARAERHVEDGADLCDGTHCQVYRGLAAATAATRAAAAATEGLVLAQNGRVIAAPFHAVCGGRTARPRDVWDDEETPDLEPVEDDACLAAPGAAWTFSLARRDVPLPRGDDRASRRGVFSRSSDTTRASASRWCASRRRAGPRASCAGFEFRKAASGLWGWASVRSTDFEVEESRPAYLLRGRGTGHGAGLCQAGAIARARRGESRDLILGLYYRGALLKRLAT